MDWLPTVVVVGVSLVSAWVPLSSPAQKMRVLDVGFMMAILLISLAGRHVLVRRRSFGSLKRAVLVGFLASAAFMLLFYPAGRIAVAELGARELHGPNGDPLPQVEVLSGEGNEHPRGGMYWVIGGEARLIYLVTDDGQVQALDLTEISLRYIEE